MLSAKIQRLIQSIKDVTNYHLEHPTNKGMLSTNWEFIFGQFDQWIVLEVSSHNKGGYWMHPTLYPSSKIDEALKSDLHDFSINPDSAAYGHVMSGDDHWIEPYWGTEGNFNNSEVPLYFNRFYYGRPKGNESYIEFNQLITHPLGLDWSPNKNAYCSINDMGEEVEKIKLIDSDNIGLILIKKPTLDKLLHLGKWVLVRYFDFNRWQGEHPPLHNCKTTVVDSENFESRFEIRTCGEDKIEYVEFRGVQIQRPTIPKKKLLSWKSKDEEDDDDKYAGFIVLDWKNGKIRDEYSLDPKNFANYFTESDLPFETSPIFFNAEVLDKYKTNPDKYELKERRLLCRGGWNLKTFDINEYNQVHTYAVYLSKLPYKEQLHWKQYNEKPNGTISKRAYQTDFEAKFPEEVPLLAQLKKSLHDLQNLEVMGDVYSIWSPKGGDWETASKGLFYLKTENQNLWHDYIISLANAVTEGFQKDSIKSIAIKFGEIDPLTGTLGLIKFILIQSQNKNLIPEIHSTLNELRLLRGQGKAHGNWKIPDGSLVEDAEVRLKAVINSLKRLKTTFENLSEL